MSQHTELEPIIEPELEAMLHSLRQPAPRSSRASALARQNFLADLDALTAVSKPADERLNKWKTFRSHFWLFKRKEKTVMFNFVMAFVMILGMVFGGGAATVAAAQGALPDGPLYAVKMWTEEMRLGWENDPQDRLELALQFTDRRAEEIKSLLMAKGDVPEPVLARFENHHHHALQLAADMPDDQIPPALLRLQEQLKLQQQTMAHLQLKDGTGEHILTRLQTMLMTHLQATERGMHDTAWLHEFVNNQFQMHEGDPVGPGEGREPHQNQNPDSNTEQHMQPTEQHMQPTEQHMQPREDGTHDSDPTHDQEQNQEHNSPGSGEPEHMQQQQSPTQEQYHDPEPQHQSGEQHDGEQKENMH